jgi:hypothetical protein
MTLLDWLPALVSSTCSTAFLGIVGAVAKSGIEKSIQSRFDAKLEGIKAEYRLQEERLRADLRSRDNDLESLRRNALSGAAARQAIIDKRQIEALERVWGAVVERRAQKVLLTQMQLLNLDEIRKMMPTASERDRTATKNFLAVMSRVCGVENMKPLSDVTLDRPFIDPLVWSIYTTYTSLLTYAWAHFSFLKDGVEHQGYLKGPDDLIAIIKKVLPTAAGFLDDNGESGLFYLGDELEEKLFTTLRDVLDGRQLDETAIKRSHEIVQMAEALARTRKADLPAAPNGITVK